MIKDIMTANESIAPNSREMEILKEHFPACFHSDGSFDLARFQEFLSDKVAVTNDGYEIRFLGKNYARLLASVDTTTVIVPDEEHNSKPENAHSENVYISGDNLDGLKHLLKSYARKVKCIYIDPPYNTGSDGFVYNDSYNFTAEELSEKLSISEEQAKRVLDLTKRGSASHSAWLICYFRTVTTDCQERFSRRKKFLTQLIDFSESFRLILPLGNITQKQRECLCYISISI